MIAWERIKYLRINLMKNLEINLTKFVLGNLRNTDQRSWNGHKQMERYITFVDCKNQYF